MKNIENAELYFILCGDRTHEHSLGGVVGESGRWGGSWTYALVALTSMQNLRLTKSTPYHLPAALTHSCNSVFTHSLFSQVQNFNIFILIIIGTVYTSCIVLFSVDGQVVFI